MTEYIHGYIIRLLHHLMVGNQDFRQQEAQMERMEVRQGDITQLKIDAMPVTQRLHEDRYAITTTATRD